MNKNYNIDIILNKGGCDKMEDENKIKERAKLIITILIIIGILITGYFIYKNTLLKTNTNNFTDYLKNNGYKKNKDNSYTKRIENNNKTIDYSFSQKTYVMFKEINIYNENTNETISLRYNNNNIIEISYIISGINVSNSYGTSYQQATYDKNNNYKCEIISSQGFKAKCDTMLKEAKTFKKEINDILKQSNTNAKYIK